MTQLITPEEEKKNISKLMNSRKIFEFHIDTNYWNITPIFTIDFIFNDCEIGWLCFTLTINWKKLK